MTRSLSQWKGATHCMRLYAPMPVCLVMHENAFGCTALVHSLQLRRGTGDVSMTDLAQASDVMYL